MRKHIEDALDWFGENIQEKPVTPASKKLFVVDNDSKQLNTENWIYFSPLLLSYFMCASVHDQI